MGVERETAVIQLQPSENKTSSYWRAMEFFRKSIEEKAHLKQPGGISEQTWIRERNLVGAYWGTPKPLKAVAEVYHMGESRVTQIVRKGMLHLWSNCSEETQKQFPEKEIKAFRKPHGMPLVITRRVEAGVTYEKLVGEFGARSVPRIRKILDDIGVNAPLDGDSKSRMSKQELKDRLEKEKDDLKIQEILNQLNPRFARRYLRGIVMPLGYMLSELAGTHTRQLSSIAYKLRALGIPVGTFEEQVSSGKQKTRRYHFVRVKDRSRIWWVLQARGNLRMELAGPKIKAICGPQDTIIPNATQLQNRERYRRIGHFLDKLGINRRDQRGFRKLILSIEGKSSERCPVPIFTYGDSLYYPVAREKELKDFLRTQLGTTQPNK